MASFFLFFFLSFCSGFVSFSSSFFSFFPPFSFFSSSQGAVLSLMLVNLDWSMFKRTKWYKMIIQKIIFQDTQTYWRRKNDTISAVQVGEHEITWLRSRCISICLLPKAHHHFTPWSHQHFTSTSITTKVTTPLITIEHFEHPLSQPKY